MKLAIYRKDGAITNIHEVREDDTEIDDKVSRFNNNGKGVVVSVEAFDDNDIVTHLYNRNTNRVNDFRDELNEISRDIHYLDKSLDVLTRTLERMGGRLDE